MENSELFQIYSNILTKNILKILIVVTILFVISLLYFVIFNKNYTIIFLYLGIGICYILGKLISKYLKFVNNNKEYELFYKDILNTVISNFERINKKEIWIMPNIFLLIVSFIYSYLILSYSFSKSLNSSNSNPNIISFFENIIIAYCIFYVIKCLFQVRYERKLLWFDFIINIGVYNMIFSFILGIIIGFLYFNIMKTFYRNKLFFQPHKVCKNNECFYDPIKSYWLYD